MFGEINKHKYLEMLEIKETSQECLRIVIAEAVSVKRTSEVGIDEEENEVLRSMLNRSNPIEVTDASVIYEIVFQDYVSYAVTNESYAGGADEVFDGELARIYSKSAFLRYIDQGTFATSDYPGPFVHYGFCCLNQIIDIVSEEPPSIDVMSQT